MKAFELNTVYTREMKDISFDLVPTETLIKLFTDGRHASHVLEKWCTSFFDCLIPDNSKNHDFIDTRTQRTVEAKTFTPKGGCKFMPSRMLGQGRVFIEEEAHAVVKSNIYCIADIIDMPVVRFIFIEGTELLKQYPSCKVTPSKRNDLFDMFTLPAIDI